MANKKGTTTKKKPVAEKPVIEETPVIEEPAVEAVPEIKEEIAKPEPAVEAPKPEKKKEPKPVLTVKPGSATDLVKLKKGDKVKVLRAITYVGRKFKADKESYDVLEVAGDRIVIGVGTSVVTAINRINVEKI